MVTWFSSIASSSALCVLGVARLTSSISTTWEKSGPGVEDEALLLAVEDRIARRCPPGSRSLVNWMRRKLQPERARQRVRQRRLADAGQVFDEQMPARQQAGDGQADGVFFADDDFTDLRDERLDPAFHAAEMSADTVDCRGAAFGNALNGGGCLGDKQVDLHR